MISSQYLQKIILFLFFGTFVFFPFFAHGQQCNYSSSLTKGNESLLLYNCKKGEIERIDQNDAVLSLEEERESLGGFVHAIAWSPDGNRAFVLSENIFPAKQTIAFSTLLREKESLNWWLYDMTSGSAVLLDKEILSIGWASNSSAIYNWDNKEIRTAKIQTSSFEEPKTITTLQSSTNILEHILPPLSSDSQTLFPLEKGFYIIQKSSEAKYIDLPDGVKKIALNPFNTSIFLVHSNNTLFSLDEKGNFSTLDADFPFIDFSFLDANLLAVADKDGNPFSYALDTQTETPLFLGGYKGIMQILQTYKGKCLFVSGDNTYIYTLERESLTPFAENSEEVLMFHFEKKPDNTLALRNEDGFSAGKFRDPNFFLSDFLKNTPSSGIYTMRLYDANKTLTHTFFFDAPKNVVFSYSLPCFNGTLSYSVSLTKTQKTFLNGSLKKPLSCTTGNISATSNENNPLIGKQPSTENTQKTSQKSISKLFLAALGCIFIIIFGGTFLLIRKRLREGR